MGEIKTHKKISVRKPEGERSCRRLRHREVENIKTNLKKKRGDCGLDSSSSGYGSLVESCKKSNVPSGFIKGRNIFEQLCDD
jgi:hypothetical protein